MRYRVGTIVVVGMLLGCQTTQTVPSAQFPVVPWEPEEAIIYQAVIDQIKLLSRDYPGHNPDLFVKILYLRDQTDLGTQFWSHHEVPLPPELEERDTIMQDVSWSRQHLQREIRYFAERLQLDLSNEILNDFVRKNLHRHAMAGSLSASLPITLVSEQEYNRLYTWDLWEAWADLHPGSVWEFSFSRVAFDKPKKTALVYVQQHSPFRIDRGIFFVISKQENAWKIIFEWKM